MRRSSALHMAETIMFRLTVPLPTCGDQLNASGAYWSRLSFRGFVDDTMDYTNSDVISRADMGELKKIGCTNSHTPPGGPCCCDMRQNTWLEVLRTALRFWSSGARAFEESGGQASEPRVSFSFPSDIVFSGTTWSTFLCDIAGVHHVTFAKAQWPVCLVGYASIFLLCSQDAIIRGDFEVALAALAQLHDILNDPAVPIDLWDCLDLSVWPLSHRSVRRHMQETLQILLGKHPQQQPQAVIDVHTIMFKSSSWTPGFGWHLARLPLTWQRCLQPPLQSLVSCWNPLGHFFTDSCLFCCDQRHGPAGYPDCFDDVFTFKNCCDASPSTSIDIVVDIPDARAKNLHQHAVKHATIAPEVQQTLSSNASQCEKATHGQLPQEKEWQIEEARRTIVELREDLRLSQIRRTRSSSVNPSGVNREAAEQEERYLSFIFNRRAAQRRLASWLEDSRLSKRSRTEVFHELDLWASSNACVHQGRWFLWDQTDQKHGQNRSRGEVDGIEFAYSNGGLCSLEGVIFSGEEVSDTRFRHVIVPREGGHRTPSYAADEQSAGVERYHMDVYWSELMQYDVPPDTSMIEWRNGTALLIKEPFWQIGHGSQEFLWLWNLFWPEPLPSDIGHLHFAFIRWAAYEFSTVGEGVVNDESGDLGAIKDGMFNMNKRNSLPSQNSLSKLYYDVLSSTMANSTGREFPKDRQLDRRGIIFATVDEEEVVGNPKGTLCFDRVFQPFRSWPGGAVLYDGLRATILHHCGIQPISPDGVVPRRLVVIERGPSILGGGRKERHWADRPGLREGLKEWGHCRGYEVRFVHFGALSPCGMAEEAANAGILFGVSGADLAIAALQPRGAAMIEVSRMCADTRGPDWEVLRENEKNNLLGGGPRPLRSKWDVGAREYLEELRARHGGMEGCPFLSHTDSSCTFRRRRYWTDGRKAGDGFLGRAGGGWYSELARQRNLMFLSLQRCECVGFPPEETLCMVGGRFGQLNDTYTPSVGVNVDLHLVPLLEAIVEEHFDLKA